MEIGIDTAGKLYLVPEGRDFPFVYRAAMGVQWDAEYRFLHSPVPDERDHAWWYQAICAAVKSEYGVILVRSEQTKWTNVSDETKQKIAAVSSAA